MKTIVALPPIQARNFTGGQDERVIIHLFRSKRKGKVTFCQAKDGIATRIPECANCVACIVESLRVGDG